jgi:hypothetical protein
LKSSSGAWPRSAALRMCPVNAYARPFNTRHFAATVGT